MGAEVFEGFDRISQVASFIKTEGYIDWCDRTDKRTRNLAIKRAMKVGSAVDALIKEKIQLPPDVFQDFKSIEEENCLKAFCDWSNQNGHVNDVRVGKRYFSDTLKITGETDLETENEIIDIKCSLAIRPEYWLQMGGYCHLLPNKTKVSILRLDKTTGAYEYQSVCDVERLKVLFVSVLNLYRYYKENENGDYGC
jgi:hypothetical protein